MADPTSHPAGVSGETAQGEAPAHRYGARLAAEIEARWQDLWERERVFAAASPGEAGFERAGGLKKKYVLDMFPYPSGAGLHVGHPLGYIATDIYARFCRMTGHNVLHAMGYDAFGLPAEQYAVQTGQHPRVTTEQNIANMRRQLRRLGLGHDPRRSVATTDVAFYRWTQWIFLQIYNAWWDESSRRARPIAELVIAYEKGVLRTPDGRSWRSLSDRERAALIDARRLAYLGEAPVNWCPALGTVLANEEVTADGKSERGNHQVYKRPMRQWMMRITTYAERLLEDLEPLDWPEPIKLMQRNWIGRSEGATVEFKVVGASDGAAIPVFTTRPDTLFGATYVVLAPEHPLAQRLAAERWAAGVPEAWKGAWGAGAPGAAATPREAVEAYRRYAGAKTDVERQVEAKVKSGVFTGAHAVNPATGAPVPVFIADYVLMGYGTGAIMAVPAHDQRDFEFARQLGLPVRDVVYSRALHSIAWFFRHVAGPDEFPMGWELALADFLGYVASRELPPARYGEALQAARALREITEPAEGAEATIGGVRGALQQVWLEALNEVLPLGFAEIKRRVETGKIHAHAEEAFTEPGVADNSPPIDGLATPDAKQKMTEWLEARGTGRRTVTYKLRDWLFSRQRYWGEPFPIVYGDDGAPRALPDDMLPVVLPELINFAPEPCDENDPACAIPQPPLARAKDWATLAIDLGEGKRTYRRELNTMPQWAGSCWYYLRYLDPENDRAFVAPEVEKYWMVSSKRGTGVPPVSPSLSSVAGLPVDPDFGPGGSSPATVSRLGVGAALEKSHRNLPHWQMGGSMYFVTFRVKQGELSGDERKAVIEACLHWHSERMNVRLVTVMPDHVHLLITPLRKQGEEWWSLSDLLHSVKSYSAHEIMKRRAASGSLWQDESFDRIVRDEDELREMWEYMRHNPVKAGLVRTAEEYAYTVAPPDVNHRRDACATEEVGFDPSLHHVGGVDLYVGGAEHAVLHLLYARFWHKVLFDLGHVSTPEPFGKLFNQGYIQAAAFTDARGVYVPAEEVVEKPPGSFAWKGQPVARHTGKMGKSLKNAIAPDDFCDEYGADTLRLYEMSMGPLEQSKPWNTRDVIGVHRLLQRVWRNVVDEQTGRSRVVDQPPDEATRRLLHKTIAGVRKDMESLGFNTAISKLTELNNHLVSSYGPDAVAAGTAGAPGLPREVGEAFTLMLAPLAPHMCEELWRRLGHGRTLAHEPFPQADASLLVDDTIELPVQVNGKLRGKITVPAKADAGAVEAAAKADEKVRGFLDGKAIRKVIVVPGKMINIVVG